MPDEVTATPYNARTQRVVEPTPAYSPENAERILALLAEYTGKLKAGYDELRTRRQRLFLGHLVLFTIVAVWAAVSLAVLIGEIRGSAYTFLITLCGGVLTCLYPLYVVSERREQRELQDRLRALSRRLETLTRWAVQIYEHSERDEIRRLELGLRLTEANAYVPQAE